MNGVYLVDCLLYHTSMGTKWSHNQDAKNKIRLAKIAQYKDNWRTVNCLRCGKQYQITQIRIDNGRGKYCSKACQYADKKGLHLSPNSEFKKGQDAWNKGIDYYPSTYKGDNVGMRALHSWVARRLGKPSKCEHCGSTTAKRYEWSNISRQYKRSLDDWQRLCTKCHMIYDGHSIINNNKKIKL